MKEAPPRGVRFSILHRAMKKQIDDYMSGEGLTGVQLFVLCELRKLEKSETREINQRDLENVSHVSHPTMTEILKRLEKKAISAAAAASRIGAINASAPPRRHRDWVSAWPRRTR